MEKHGAFKKLIVSYPLTGREFVRYAWVEYNSHEEAKNALVGLTGSKISHGENGPEFEVQVHIHVRRNYDDMYGRTELVPAVFSDPDRMLIDLAQARRLMDTLDKEKEIEGNPLSESDPATASTPDLLRATLDKIVLYLRHVHYFDYYHGLEYFTEDSLLLHGGFVVLRGSPPNLAPSKPTAAAATQTLDARVNSRIDHPLTMEDLNGSKCVEKVIESEVDRHATQLEPEKVRCEHCQKLFKSIEFIKKHLLNKHPNLFQVPAQDEQFFVDYCADPHRVTASMAALARFERDSTKNRREWKDQGNQGQFKQRGRDGNVRGRGADRSSNGAPSSNANPLPVSPPPGTMVFWAPAPLRSLAVA